MDSRFPPATCCVALRAGRGNDKEREMKIFVKAKPNSKKEKIEKFSETNFTVSVCAPPIKGRANQAVIRALADYFNISPSRLRIAAGTTSRNKIIEIN